MTLNKVNESDLNKVGVRAIDLAKVYQDKIETAPTFIVTNFYLDEFLSSNGLDVKIKKLVDSVNFSDGAALNNAYEQIVSWFKDARLSDSLKDQLKEAYESLGMQYEVGGADDFIGTEEPIVNLFVSPDYISDVDSVKGVFLNVDGFSDFINALKSCWLSLFSVKELVYRYKKGLRSFNSGVIVQKLKSYDFSAEVFTKGDFAEYDILVKVYKGLFDITKSVSKDEFSVTYDSININTASIVRQEFAIIPSKKSAVLIKRGLGSRGEGQKISNPFVLELSRLSKKAKLLLGFDVFIVFGIFDKKIQCLLVSRLDAPDSTLKRQESFVSLVEEDNGVSEENFDEIDDNFSDDEEDVSLDVSINDSEEVKSSFEDNVVNDSEFRKSSEEESSIIGVSGSDDDFILGNVEEDESGIDTSDFKKDSSYYIDLISDVESTVDDKIYMVYRQRYGDEPLSLDDALARLSENSDIVGLDAIQAMKALKAELERGNDVSLDNFEVIIKEARLFPGS